MRGQSTVKPPVVDVPVLMQRQFQQFFLSVVEVPQIQFTDRVLACSCVTERSTHSANCANECGDPAGAIRGTC